MVATGRVDPHPALVQSFALEWQHAGLIFEPLLRYNRAHVAVATEAGIIPREQAGELLGAIDRLSANGLAALELNDALDGLQPNIEAHLKRQCGADVSGWLSVGRARQECEFVARQIAQRDALLVVGDNVLALLEALLELGEREAETVMPYATWGQSAEPITLGYYFTAVAESLVADLVRLQAAYVSASRSRADIGQFTPSPLPIDRDRVASLLGFDTTMRSSLYAYASLDAELQTLSSLAILLGGLARVCENLFVWCSSEFGFLKFAAEFSGTSYLMPQKRNPYALRMVRPVASKAVGAWNEAIALYSGGLPIVGNGLIHVPNRTLETVRAASEICGLLALSFPTIEADRKRMKAAAASGWAQAPQLVYMLVERYRIPFRQAHHVVAVAIGELTATETPAAAEAVAEALTRAAANDTDITVPDVASALDVEALVATRVNGGPAPASVRRQINALSSVTREARAWLDSQTRRQSQAQAELDKTTCELIG